MITPHPLALISLLLLSPLSHAAIDAAGGSHTSIGIGPLSVDVGSLVGHLFGHHAPAETPDSASAARATTSDIAPPTAVMVDTPATVPKPAADPQAISIIAPFPAAPTHERGQLQILICPMAGASNQIYQLKQSSGLTMSESPLPNLGCDLALVTTADDSEALQLRTQLRALHPDWIIDANSRQYPLAGPVLAGAIQASSARLYATQHMQLSPTAGDAHGIKIGVIDSPLSNDPLLRTAGITRYSALSPSDSPAPATHGNQIATLIAGQSLANGFSGLTSGASLYWANATRQIDGQSSTNSYLLIRAVDWMLGQQVQLLNISLGGSRDDVLTAIFNRLAAQPMLIIAAAGNGGAAAAPVYPAAFPAVLAITATDAVDHDYHDATHGDYITLAAPGVDVWVPRTADSGSYVSGTSFSTALVTGSLARLGVQRLSQPKATLITQLCRSAKDLGTAGKDPVYGCGLVQMAGMGLGVETMRVK
jgi:hypothetical protein